MLNAKRILLTALIISATLFTPISFASEQGPLTTDMESITGTLEILVADNFEAGISERQYFLRILQDNGSYRSVPLSFASIAPDHTLKSGERITVAGRWIDNRFAAQVLQRTKIISGSDTSRRAPGQPRSAPPSTGTRRAVVLILEMDDAEKNYRSRADIEALVFAGTRNVKGLYAASSYNQITFEFDVYRPLDISSETFDTEGASATENCTIGNQNPYKQVIDKWANLADEAARRENIDLSQYQHRIYILPHETNCGWLGMGTDGCVEEDNGGNWGCRVWVPVRPTHDPEEAEEGAFIAHELGHNIGWEHSTDPKKASNTEYGDHSGIMGFPRWAQANAPHRDQAGWFDQYPDAVTTAECSGTFELNALELMPNDAPARPHIVKTPIPGTDEFFYISYRTDAPQTAPYSSQAAYARRINIHRHDGIQPEDRLADKTIHIENLLPGDRYQDGTTGITVIATETTDLTAAVSVDIPNDAPEAIFTYTLLDGHLEVQFNNASEDADNNIAAYRWRISGNTITEENPTYTFPGSGSYNVSLTATDICGRAHTLSERILVVANKPPEAAFTHTANHLSVQFNAEIEDKDGTIKSYQWDFGDGTPLVTDTEDPVHVFARGGTYTIKLTVTDDDDATTEFSDTLAVVANKPPKVDFSVAADGLNVTFTDTSQDDDGAIASRTWKFFDDDSESDLETLLHNYATPGTYKVQLTVTDDDGTTNTEIKDITVNAGNVNVPPTADFTLKADTLSVTFTDASTDSDGEITNHQWDFGDGATSGEASPLHTYAAPGTYTVQLTVTDTDGATDTLTNRLTVDTSNVPPTAAFSYAADGLGVQFTNTSTDSDGEIASATHQWDFGDGTTATETSPQHTFPAAGTYTVQLTVTDEADAPNTFTEDIDVGQIGVSALEEPSAGGGGGGGCFAESLSY